MQTSKPVAVAAKINMNTGEIDEVVKQMIAIQMDAFEAEMKQIKLQSRKIMEYVMDKNMIFRMIYVIYIISFADW